jgi:hypothetical protein
VWPKTRTASPLARAGRFGDDEVYRDNDVVPGNPLGGVPDAGEIQAEAGAAHRLGELGLVAE